MRNIEGELLCPTCGEPMRRDRKFNFWKCPNCKGEWWPEDEPDGNCSPALVSRYGGEILPIVPIPKKRRGNRKSGRRRRKPVKKWKPTLMDEP